MHVKKATQKSGKFVLRLPSELHQAVCLEADRQGCSLNQWITQRLATSLGKTAHSEVVDLIKAAFGEQISGVMLFGSTARGESHASSDIDLLLVLKPSIKLNRTFYSKWDEDVGPHVASSYSPHFVEWPKDILKIGSLWLEVASEGEFLDCESPELRQALHRIKQMIASGRFIRKSSSGSVYWITQPEALDRAK